jgi:hypothetical protein
MPDKAYDRVLQLLQEIKAAGYNGEPELARLHETMTRCRETFLAAVARGKDPAPVTAPGEPEDDGDRVAGPLRRLPKGAVIESEGGEEIFVPEIWVRRLGMEQGDVVSAVPLGLLDRSQLYEFTVEERRGRGDTADRVSVIAPVSFHGGEWFVYSEEEESLITLKPREVRELRLEEGDLVEVAYPAGDMASARVAWKFDPGEVMFDEGARGPGPGKQSAKERVVRDVGDPVLSGKAVLVVGGDLYREAFRQNFERRGADFMWESGFQGGQGRSIESKVRSADVVVMVTEMMSHRLPNVEAMCRRYRKPYVYAPSKGATGAVRACQKALLK